MTLVRLIEMCLNETYSRVSVDKHMYDAYSGLVSSQISHG